MLRQAQKVTDPVGVVSDRADRTASQSDRFCCKDKGRQGDARVNSGVEKGASR